MYLIHIFSKTIFTAVDVFSLNPILNYYNDHTRVYLTFINTFFFGSYYLYTRFATLLMGFDRTYYHRAVY
jgi:hypothetical protein